MSFLRNVWNGNLLNLFTSPLLPFEFLLGTMILGIIKMFFTLALVSLLAFLMYSFDIFSLGFALIPFLANLLIFGWVIGTFTTALIIRYGMRIQSFAWSLVAIFNPLSAVFYPVSTLPLIFRKIALALPSAHVFEGMRDVLATGVMPKEHLLWAFILNFIYLSLTSAFFLFMFEKARDKGKLAKIET